MSTFDDQGLGATAGGAGGDPDPPRRHRRGGAPDGARGEAFLELLGRVSLRAFPRRFRRRHGRDLLELHADLRRRRRTPLPVAALRLAGDLLRQGLAARVEAWGRRPPGRGLRGGWETPMESFVQDLRFAVRTLAKAPLSTAVAVLSIGMGIAASTVVFGYVDSFLLRPLPYEEPERLWHLWSDTRTYDRSRVSLPDFHDWRRQADGFADLAAFNYTLETLTGGELPEQVSGARISANALSLLGVEPILGRGFAAGEDTLGADPVALISESFWRERHGADPDVLGRTLEVDGRRHTIVGVMGEDFHFPIPTTAVWLPRVLDPPDPRRDHRFLQVVGRLAPGVTVQEARAEMERVAAGLEARHPETNEDVGVRLEPLRQALNFAFEPIRTIGMLTAAATAFVLLIACANVAGLLLSRGAVRRREIAVRAALGAGRGRIVRQLLTESLLLALLGGAAGVVVGGLGAGALQRLLPADVYRVGEVAVDARGLGVALGLSLLTAVAAGLVPALRVTGRDRDLTAALKEGGRAAAGAGGQRSQAAMVIVEMSLAIVLLVATALMLRSVGHLRGVDPGFATADVLSLRMLLPQERYASAPDVAGFHRRLVDSVSGLPGVEAAATVDYLPLNHETRTVEFLLPGEEERGSPWRAQGVVASPGYFEALRIPLLRGRSFRWSDGADAEPVVVVDRRLAERHWPDGDPVGRQVLIGDVPRRVVGVVASVRQVDLAGEARPLLYLAQPQAPGRYLRLLVRAAGEPAGMVGAVRDRLADIDPLLPVSEVRTLGDVVHEFLLPQRLAGNALAVLALGALLLASVGVYGLMAFFVARRTREIGLQMALGARAGDIRRAIAGRILRLAGIASAIGVALSLATTRFLRGFLYGVGAGDPATLAAATGFLLLVALAAGILGARRATRVDPMSALRTE